MKEDKKPLDFLSWLLEPHLLREFVDYVISELCDQFSDDKYGLLIEIPDPKTGISKTFIMTYNEVVEREVVKAKERLLSDIAEEIVQKEDLKFKAAIVDHYYSTISYLAAKIDEKKHLKAYPFVGEIIKDIKKTIEEKYLEPLDKYLQMIGSQEKRPKIQWLGNNNLLGTLVYDLWKGQIKGTKKAERHQLNSLIKASKEDLMTFIEDNFISKNGKPFTKGSLSDILSKSEAKDTAKVKIGGRIELDYK